MNTPTHLAAGAMAAQLALVGGGNRCRRSVMLAGCFFFGVATHLLLDLVPHYAWIVYLPSFEGLPFHWLIREAVLGLAVALPLVYCLRARWGCVVLGMAGAVYPDLEKVAYVDAGLPDWAVLFRWHSMALSNRTGSLPSWALILLECVLILAMTLCATKMAQQRKTLWRQ